MILMNDNYTSHKSAYLYSTPHCIQLIMKTCEVRVKVARYEEDYIIDSVSQMQAKRYEEFFTGYYNSRMTKYLLRVLRLHIICCGGGGRLGGWLFVCLFGVFRPISDEKLRI